MISSSYTEFRIKNRLSFQNWNKQKDLHITEVAHLIDNYLEKRSQQQKDPVMDFLFEYYAFRPSRLKRWSPGLGVLLEGAGRDTAPELSELALTDEGAFLDPGLFPDNRKTSVQWIYGLLEKSSDKKPAFGCFGMHEWAMVYKQQPDEVRHNRLPLRMDRQELADFVESRPLVCTHYDAFRFFTEAARPLNRFELKRDGFAETEQPGCIHSNMDLYKWGFKMYPWISSDTIREAFKLALEARYIDMKASPYDLRDRGLEPIKIETEAGRMEYIEKQRGIYEKSVPVREQLIREYRGLMEALGIEAAEPASSIDHA